MSSLTAKEICEIIKACKDSEVSSLKFGELKLKFGPPKAKFVRPEQTQEISEIDYEPTEDSVEIDPNLETTQKEILDEVEMANLALEDPEAYEEMLLGLEDHEIDEVGEDNAEAS